MSKPNDIRDIALDRIHTTDLDRPADKGLVESVKQHGILQPVALVADGDGYRPIFGTRRLDAARKAGLATIPATLYPANTAPADLRILTIVENAQREDATPLEQGRLFAELTDLGISIAEVARRVGKPVHFVSHRIRLASLPAHVLDAFPKEYSVSAAALLCRLPVPVLMEVLDSRPEAATDVEMARDAVRAAGRDLDAAPFPTSDCGSCRKHTDADRQSFGTGPDRCFDPDCYDGKVAAHVGAAVAAIRRTHPTAPCFVTSEANHTATPELGELFDRNGALPLPRKKRIAEKGEEGTPAICLDGGTVKLVHLTDDDPHPDGRALRYTETGGRALALRKRLDDALDGEPRTVTDRELATLVKRLVAALEGVDNVSATSAWASLLRLHAPALRRLASYQPDADFEDSARRLSALLP